MLIARRIYLYLVSFISLMMLLAGASNLLRLVLEMWLVSGRNLFGDEKYWRDQFSLWGAVLIVGAVVWTIHWILAQKSVDPSRPEAPQERDSALRKLMIYAVLLVTLWQVAIALEELFQSILGAMPNTDSFYFRNTLSGKIPVVLTSGLGWIYYWWVRQTDNRIQPEQQGGATLRRWYFYLVSYATLSLLLFHSAGLAYNTWRISTSDIYNISEGVSWIPVPIAYDLAWLLVALPGWLWHWTQTQRITATSNEEQHSVLRKVYIYAAIVQTVAVTVTSLAFFMYHLLRFALGSTFETASGESLLTAAGQPLCNALVYGIFWAFYTTMLDQDTRLLAKEPPLQANLRRLYHHLVALVSLAVLSVGLARLVRILLDLWLGGDTATIFTRDSWSREISLFTTLILAGGPIWYFSWNHLQQQALGQEESDERRSVFRRIYLYLVVFLSVVTLLGSTAWLFYQIFLIIGEPITQKFLSNISWALGATATGALLLVYHLRVLLGDLQAKAPVIPTIVPAALSTPQTVLLFLQGSDPATVSEVAMGLKSKLPPESLLDLIPAADLSLPELKYWLLNRQTSQTAKPESTAPTPIAQG